MESALRKACRSLLPSRCLLCGAGGGPVPGLCGPCAGELPRLEHACPVCAVPLPVTAPCPRCTRRSPPFARAHAPLLYAPPASGLVQQLKFGGRLAAGRCLGVLLGRHLREHLERRPQVVVPVPLHPRRLRERGFNQALEISRDVAALLGLPVAPEMVRRVRGTTPQSRLGEAAERRRNVRGAFRVSADLTGIVHVAVLDDVMTTGATLAEVARVLRRAGVAQVEVWACLRAAG